MQGTARFAPVPIIAAVDEASTPGRGDDVEMEHFSELSDDLEEEILVPAAVGARTLLNKK